jgi:undecaprenyl-diphosphatase
MLAGGALVALGSIAAFGGATEDVTQHNGQALHDVARLHFFTQHRSTWLVDAAKAVSDLGSVVILAALALVVGFWLWRCGNPLLLAAAPAIALAVSGVTVAVLKSVVGRARPPVALHLVRESDASFPSGHATDSTAVFIAVALVLAIYVLRRPLARVLVLVGAGLLSAAIGTSRLLLGVHWPTDVLAGWALGLAIATVIVTICAVVGRVLQPFGRTTEPTEAGRTATRSFRRTPGELRAA